MDLPLTTCIPYYVPAHFHSTHPFPFKKTAIFKQAIELGAQSLSDLTDRVTHLIALEPGSAKYKVSQVISSVCSLCFFVFSTYYVTLVYLPQCALENRIPIMHPNWITESHQIWLKGDDVDFHQVRDLVLPLIQSSLILVPLMHLWAIRACANTGSQYSRPLSSHFPTSSLLKDGQRSTNSYERMVGTTFETWNDQSK